MQTEGCLYLKVNKIQEVSYLYQATGEICRGMEIGQDDTLWGPSLLQLTTFLALFTLQTMAYFKFTVQVVDLCFTSRVF